MSLLLGIITSYLMFNVWLWIAGALFGETSKTAKLFLLGSGLLVALLLYSLPKILGHRNIDIDRFGLYSSGFIATALGYMILASQEEILKFLSGYANYLKEHLHRNDLVLYSILIALGFALGENIIYLVTLQQETIQENVSLALTRGLTGFLGHSIFTGTIGFFVGYEKFRTGAVLRTFFAFLIGIGLHLGYNLLLHYGIIRGFLLYVVLAYLLLTYLFYISDKVYLDYT